MKTLSYQRKADILLALTFLIFVGIIEYFYPIPQITWDGDSYVQYSQSLVPNIRPIGYSAFLGVLYLFSHSLSFIAYAQFFIYFASILFLLKVVNNYKPLSFLQYYLLGAFLLVEPAALYNSITILSDILFASLTYLYLATLLLYINNRKRQVLIGHIFIIFLCIETRHIGGFFPFFTIVFMFLYLKNRWLVMVNTLAILFIFFCIYLANVEWNYKTYGVKTYSAFSGWTEANNALFVVPHIRLDPQNISDPEIRRLHTFFATYLDTTSYKPNGVGPDYLWAPQSPLNVLRKSVDDSLVKKRGYGDFYLTWYILAPQYEKYGSYIARKFPREYVMNFMVPNVSSLIRPYDAEMADYDMARNDISEGSLKRYNLTASMLHCRQQIYKDHINAVNLLYYQLRLVLFLAALLSLFIFRRSFDAKTIQALFVFCTFILLYYFTILSSSSFTPRILLPVLPMLTMFIFITAISLTNRLKKAS